MRQLFSPILACSPSRRPQLAHLGQVMTLLKLSLTDTTGNKSSAMGINTMGEELTRDTDPLTAAVG